jgi:hypothetical protein
MNCIKVCIFLILTFLISFASSYAQDREFVVGSMIGFYGIHQMGEIESLYSQTAGDVGGTGDLSLGLNVRRDISQRFFLAFELRYIRKGSIYSFISNYSTQAFESIRLDYIEIPFLTGYKIPISKKYLIAETGIAYARLVSSKMMISDLNPWDYTSVMDNFRKNELSWIVNLKYPIVRNRKLLAGIRFSYAIFSVHENYSIHNMNYGIEFYYLFNKEVN